MQLDVRTKLFIVFILSSMALIYQDPIILSVIFIINAIILKVFNVKVKIPGAFKKLILMLIVLITLQSLFVKTGEPLLVIGKLTLLTTQGVIYGISIILRYIILIFLGLIILDCDIMELIIGLVKVGIPYDIVFTVQVAMRFMPVFISEMQNTVNAIQLRGVDLRKVYKRKVLKVYISIFSPVVYSVWNKALKLSILADLRGFRLSPERTYYRDISLKKLDYIVMATSVIFTILFIYAANNVSYIYNF